MGRHFTSREFNQDIAAAKRASRDGPVFISDRGRPAHVLMSWGDWRRITQRGGTLAELLCYPGTEDIDLDSLIPPRTVELQRDPFADDGDI